MIPDSIRASGVASSPSLNITANREIMSLPYLHRLNEEGNGCKQVATHNFSRSSDLLCNDLYRHCLTTLHRCKKIRYPNQWSARWIGIGRGRPQSWRGNSWLSVWHLILACCLSFGPDTRVQSANIWLAAASLLLAFKFSSILCSIEQIALAHWIITPTASRKTLLFVCYARRRVIKRGEFLST